VIAQHTRSTARRVQSDKPAYSHFTSQPRNSTHSGRLASTAITVRRKRQQQSFSKASARFPVSLWGTAIDRAPRDVVDQDASPQRHNTQRRGTRMALSQRVFAECSWVQALMSPPRGATSASVGSRRPAVSVVRRRRIEPHKMQVVACKFVM